MEAAHDMFLYQYITLFLIITLGHEHLLGDTKHVFCLVKVRES